MYGLRGCATSADLCVPPQERSELLRRWSDLMLLHRDQLARLVTFECVSTLAC